jgi:fructose-1,6-bisphosphatase
MAFLIEKAGGKTDDGTGKSVLDVKIKGLEQRVSFVAGSVFEVDKMRELVSDSGKT